MFNLDDTITAPATAPGGALSLIRISGADALALCDKVFRSPAGKKLSERKGYSLLYGNIVYPDGKVLDDVVVSVFRAPNSYTGEDMAEISCHGSRYITAEITNLLTAAGARAADAGEFTSRAFIAGKLDLSQAEAVADMISSHDRATHALAVNQMRGGYSGDLDALRGELLRLTSLLELELDFSEEDVTFADRSELTALLEKISCRIEELLRSFALGNAIKEGVGVAIIGSPNAGKSTLLNTLLNEDRAMVSDIAGTTRDAIEERISLGGMEFRFIDTAGIRDSDDALELMGMERTFKAIGKARVILYLFDVTALAACEPSVGAAAGVDNSATFTECNVQEVISTERPATITECAAAKITSAISEINPRTGQELCILLNKCDPDDSGSECWQELAKDLKELTGHRVIPISAKYSHNIGELTGYLTLLVDADPVYRGATIISNSRHYDALHKTRRALRHALAGLSGNVPESISENNDPTYLPDNDPAYLPGNDPTGLPGNTPANMPWGVCESIHISSSATIPTDLIAQDIREALHWLGTITGEITTDEILGNIFSKFCIGK